MFTDYLIKLAKANKKSVQRSKERFLRRNPLVNPSSDAIAKVRANAQQRRENVRKGRHGYLEGKRLDAFLMKELNNTSSKQVPKSLADRLSPPKVTSIRETMENAYRHFEDKKPAQVIKPTKAFPKKLLFGGLGLTGLGALGTIGYKLLNRRKQD